MSLIVCMVVVNWRVPVPDDSLLYLVFEIRQIFRQELVRGQFSGVVVFSR